MVEKSNFNKFGKKPIQTSTRIEAARMHATLFLILGFKFYSQWFKGEKNKVPDVLSRDDNRNDKELPLAPHRFPLALRFVHHPTK